MKEMITLVAGVVFLAVFLTAQWLGGMGTFSTGIRVGTVQKVSDKGMWCPTTSGELVLDSFGSRAAQKTGTPLSDTWEFAAQDPAVKTALEKAAESGKRVKIAYKEWFIKPWCLNSDYEATAVTELP